MSKQTIEEVFYGLSGLLHEQQVDVSGIHFVIRVDSPRNAAAIERMFHEWVSKNAARAALDWSWPRSFQMYGITIDFILDWVKQ